MDYFPTSFWETDRMLAEMACDQLRAMQEPSLLNLQGIDAYRFTWLRTFHQPVCIRIQRHTDGIPTLTAKITTGNSTARPGILRYDISQWVKLGELYYHSEHQLQDAEFETLADAFKAMDFWNLPTMEHRLVLDGATWLLEGITQGNYHLATRWSPEMGAYRDTALSMLAYAQIEVENIY